MRLYDFSAYARKRDEARSAEQVKEFVSHLNEPGAVLEFKRRIEGWFALHHQILNIKSGT